MVTGKISVLETIYINVNSAVILFKKTKHTVEYLKDYPIAFKIAVLYNIFQTITLFFTFSKAIYKLRK